MGELTIGQLAASAGVGIETIRYYERESILPVPRRTPSGYRTYDETDVWRLAFIGRGKALGFTLRDIAELLGVDRSVADVQRITRNRLAEVEAELIEVIRRRDALEALLRTCTDGSSEDCVQLGTVQPVIPPGPSGTTGAGGSASISAVNASQST
jgi:DNA-binding transcriptional MerR regulator